MWIGDVVCCPNFSLDALIGAGAVGVLACMDCRRAVDEWDEAYDEGRKKKRRIKEKLRPMSHNPFQDELVGACVHPSVTVNALSRCLVTAQCADVSLCLSCCGVIQDHREEGSEMSNAAKKRGPKRGIGHLRR